MGAMLLFGDVGYAVSLTIIGFGSPTDGLGPPTAGLGPPTILFGDVGYDVSLGTPVGPKGAKFPVAGFGFDVRLASLPVVTGLVPVCGIKS